MKGLYLALIGALTFAMPTRAQTNSSYFLSREITFSDVDSQYFSNKLSRFSAMHNLRSSDGDFVLDTYDNLNRTSDNIGSMIEQGLNTMFPNQGINVDKHKLGRYDINLSKKGGEDIPVRISIDPLSQGIKIVKEFKFGN